MSAAAFWLHVAFLHNLPWIIFALLRCLALTECKVQQHDEVCDNDRMIVTTYYHGRQAAGDTKAWNDCRKASSTRVKSRDVGVTLF